MLKRPEFQKTTNRIASAKLRRGLRGRKNTKTAAVFGPRRGGAAYIRHQLEFAASISERTSAVFLFVIYTATEQSFAKLLKIFQIR